MNERELLAAIVELCDSLDAPVRWVHIRDSRREPGPWVCGLPDLFLLGEHACMWRELKGSGTLHRGQLAWRQWLWQAGQDAGVWHVSDLCNGRIEAELRGLNEPRPGQVADTPEEAWLRVLYRPQPPAGPAG